MSNVSDELLVARIRARLLGANVEEQNPSVRANRIAEIEALDRLVLRDRGGDRFEKVDGDPTWQDRVHVAADRIDRAVSLVDLNKEVASKADGAVCLGDSPLVRATRMADSPPSPEFPLGRVTAPGQVMRKIPLVQLCAVMADCASAVREDIDPGSWVVTGNLITGLRVSGGGEDLARVGSASVADHIVITQPLVILALVDHVRRLIQVVEGVGEELELAGVNPSMFRAELSSVLEIKVP